MSTTTILPWFLFLGKPGEPGRASAMAAGWILNLAVAEVIIHRRRRVQAAGPQSAVPA